MQSAKIISMVPSSNSNWANPDLAEILWQKTLLNTGNPFANIFASRFPSTSFKNEQAIFSIPKNVNSTWNSKNE